jgi:hypothetical protein
VEGGALEILGIADPVDEGARSIAFPSFFQIGRSVT